MIQQDTVPYYEVINSRGFVTWYLVWDNEVYQFMGFNPDEKLHVYKKMTDNTFYVAMPWIACECAIKENIDSHVLLDLIGVPRASFKEGKLEKVYSLQERLLMEQRGYYCV